MKRIRIDKLLVERGLAPSRERARALIMAGKVLVDETPVEKAGTAVDGAAEIRVKGKENSYVSRGGIKLDGALDDLRIDVSGKVVLDIGSSTGGFTEACLRRGATSVYAVDEGTNQLEYSLRRDPRVTSLEKTNARNLTPEQLPGLADFAVIDVSFISLTKVLPAVLGCLKREAAVLAMVKPQFEVGKGQVGKGGVVREPELREEAVRNVIEAAQKLGVELLGRVDARITGPKGNQETFIYLGRS